MASIDTLIDGTTRKSYSTKETAQFIRQALKSAFPGVTFSVRTAYASCYSATGIRWTDGPTESEVRLVTSRFESQSFDGMTDATRYHDQICDGERVSFQGWINLHRNISPALMARAEQRAQVVGAPSVWSIVSRMRANGCLVNVKSWRG
jgi:hypothetical protein